MAIMPVAVGTQYHKIPMSGRFLKVTSERDIPVFSNDDIGIITDEDDIIVYQVILTIALVLSSEFGV
jgi:hypothetical protein